MVRLWPLILALACGGGPAYAPVSAVLDYRDTGPDGTQFSMAASKQLNPQCAANCELGDAFPDGGGSRGWFPLVGGGRDGGVRWGPPQDVAVGAEVQVLVITSRGATCDEKHVVPLAGFTVTAVVDSSGCSLSYR